MDKVFEPPRNATAGFLTVSDLIERLRISRRTLRTHVERGHIPAIKLGARVLFDWESVREALLRRQSGGDA